MHDNCFLSLNQVIPMALNSRPHVKSALLIRRGGGPGGLSDLQGFQMK
jgi:hypothetical protein